MLSPTQAESKIKKALVKELELLTNINSNNELLDKVINNGENNTNLSVALSAISTFFSHFNSMPIYELFSKQGEDAVLDYLKNKEPNSAAIIDFLLRFKSFVFENSEIFEDVKNILYKDSILENVVTKEKTSLVVNNAEDAKKYYVLIIIYIYNNVGE